jgi:hypothetical protein
MPIEEERPAWWVKPGQVLNPSGNNGWTEGLRAKRVQYRECLLHELSEPCQIPEFKGMSWLQAGLRTLLICYVSGEPWAVKEVHNRAFERVPMNIDISQQEAMRIIVSLPDNGRERKAPAPPMTIDVGEGASAEGTEPMDPADDHEEHTDDGND